MDLFCEEDRGGADLTEAKHVQRRTENHDNSEGGLAPEGQELG